MIYTANITTSMNTPQTSLTQTVLRVTKGLVYKVEVYLPAGSAGLMGVAVFDGLFQLWPSTVGDFFVGEDQQIAFDDMYLKESAPYQFDIYSYNTDDTYDHFASVRVGLVSKEIYLARFLPTKSHDYFAGIMRQLQAEQEERARAQKELIAETPFEWLLKQEEAGR